MGCMRLNHLTAPFNNPAIRRAVLKGIDQKDFCIASSGEDPAMWHTPTGLDCPQSPFATDAGLEVFTSPRDYDAVKKEDPSRPATRAKRRWSWRPPIFRCSKRWPMFAPTRWERWV